MSRRDFLLPAAIGVSLLTIIAMNPTGRHRGGDCLVEPEPF